ncbi:MAG: hypothetical protein RDU47_08720, partial [Spirochaetia bacterium]|nr:hypothetical protein [Spirochaetia bacterium]
KEGFAVTYLPVDGQGRVKPEDVAAAIRAVKNGQLTIENRSFDFAMRPEQQTAVEKTAEYFANWRRDRTNHDKPAHFLWNCKMRFGKTFAA